MPPADQPKRAVGLIRYELHMLQATYDLYFGSRAIGASDEAQNSLLEAFLLHARVLRDFFTAVPELDDVSAEHYVLNPAAWRQDVSGCCPYLMQQRDRMNRALAHLSYSRLEYAEQGAKNWDLPRIRAELDSLWSAFLDALDNRRQGWFLD